ncbi:hypothetical protein [Salsipaludibacter albus]|uniref:hypothetical protein n=1 Tax=Salsipaludibacter albus TaxID=2849650 RepID=UPI001EE4AB83|nr:hypothetical protein [Salsipaludibacter albus]MBY5162354.1 hypothetical protein [Salsipaludibacter albus]
MTTACVAPPSDAARSAAALVLGEGVARGAALMPDADTALRAVAAGTCEVAVVPWEDSHAGTATDTVDALVFTPGDLVVCAEVDRVEDGRTTRWVAVRAADDAARPAVGDRVQTLLFAVPHLNRPGSLTEMLAAFSSRGINVTRFEPRPLHAALGMYGFLLEVEGHPADPWLADALADLLTASSVVTHLGTWEAGTRAWSAVTGRAPEGPVVRDRADVVALGERWSPATTSRDTDGSGGAEPAGPVPDADRVDP